MKNHLKLFIIAIAIAALIAPIAASAVTIEELQAQIQELLQKIQKLQSQQVQTPTVTTLKEMATEERQNIPSFNKNLYFGVKNNPDVTDLQEFLADQGYYAGPISGNFGLLTLSAVKKFQSANGISPTGYFGPRSRAIAGEIMQKLVGQICPREEECEGNILPSKKIILYANSDLRGTVGEYFEAIFKISGGSGSYEIHTVDEVGKEFSDGLEGDGPGGFCEKCKEPRKIPADELIIFGVPQKSGALSFTMVVKDQATAAYGKERFTIIFKEKAFSDRPPIISGIKGPTTLKVGEEGVWSINAQDPSNGALVYRVIWGDEVSVKEAKEFGVSQNAVPFKQTATFAHTYIEPGVYNPTFYVVNDRGLDVKTSITVNVTGAVAVGKLYIEPANPYIQVGQTIQLQAMYRSPMPKCDVEGISCAAVIPASYPVAVLWSTNQSGVLVLKHDGGEGVPADKTYVTGLIVGDAEVKAVYTFPNLMCASPACPRGSISVKTNVNVTDTAKPSITVLSPNGGEKWQVGQAMTFYWQWSGSNAPLQPTFYLYSIASGQTIFGMMSSSNISFRSDTDKQVGSFDALLNYPNVSIPGFVLGGQYKIKVCEYPEGSNNPSYPSRAPVCDFSDAPFTITSATLPTLPPPSFNVVSPTISWSAGSTQTINWSSSNYPSTAMVKVQLYQNQDGTPPTLTLYLNLVVPNTGSASWTIPTTVVQAHNYRISVTCDDAELRTYGSCSGGMSQPFGIIAPAVSTITPSKTTVASGETISVSWTNNGTTYAKDWIGVAPTKGQWSSAYPWFYTDGLASGTKTIAMPALAGSYDLVYYPNNGFTELTRTGPITVAARGAESGGSSAINASKNSASILNNIKADLDRIQREVNNLRR